MEVAAAEILWRRSVEYKFRYTMVLSYGDAKTFIHLSALKVYGDNVTLEKEECINHVAKRLGTVLRKVLTDNRTLGVTLGGKKPGLASGPIIIKLTVYYQQAIRITFVRAEENKKRKEVLTNGAGDF